MEAIILMVGAVRHFAWRFVAYEDMGMMSKGLAAVAILWLLFLVHRQFKTKLMVAVLLWWAWEETQVALCSFWYIMSPWNVPKGIPICSAKAGIDIGAFSLVIMMAIVVRIVISYSSAKSAGETK